MRSEGEHNGLQIPMGI